MFKDYIMNMSNFVEPSLQPIMIGSTALGIFIGLLLTLIF